MAGLAYEKTLTPALRTLPLRSLCSLGRAILSQLPNVDAGKINLIISSPRGSLATVSAHQTGYGDKHFLLFGDLWSDGTAASALQAPRSYIFPTSILTNYLHFPYRLLTTQRKRERKIMDLNKFTQKAQQAVLNAQQLAREFNHQTIEPGHLLLSLLNQT